MCQIEFSTVGVEQAHGSVATCHKYHPTLGLVGLCLRSHAHQVRAIWPRTASNSSGGSSTADQTRQINRITGRNVFFASMMDSLSGSGAVQLSQEDKERVMRAHGHLWSLLSWQQQAHHNRIAARQRQAQLQAENVARLRSEASLALLTRERQQQTLAEEQGLALWRNFQLSAGELDLLSSRLRESTSQVAQAKTWFRECTSAPDTPPATTQEALSIFSATMVDDVPSTRAPSWVKIVCGQRDHFALKVLRHVHEGITTYCLMASAYCNPFLVCFCCVSPEEDDERMSPEAASAHRPSFRHSFLVSPNQFLEFTNFSAWKSSDIMVLPVTWHLPWKLVSRYY